jgi:hypothetical protein
MAARRLSSDSSWDRRSRQRGLGKTDVEEVGPAGDAGCVIRYKRGVDSGRAVIHTT